MYKFEKNENINIYNSDNLSFFHFSNYGYQDNLILYKSKLSCDEYDTENIIREFINNYNNRDFYKLYQSSNIKFLNYDKLFQNILNNKIQNNNIVGYDIKFQQYNFDSVVYVFDKYSRINLTLLNNISFKFNMDPYKFNDNSKLFLEYIIDNIIKNITIINSTNFETIEEYLYIFDFGSFTFGKSDINPRTFYKNISTTVSDLETFNNYSFDFTKIDNYYNNNKEKFQLFLNTIEMFPENLEFKYNTFKRSKIDNIKTFKIHFPLLFLNFNLTFLLKLENYDHPRGRYPTFSSRYCLENTKSLLKIYFYIFNESKIYNKFIDTFEKSSLKK